MRFLLALASIAAGQVDLGFKCFSKALQESAVDDELEQIWYNVGNSCVFVGEFQLAQQGMDNKYLIFFRQVFWNLKNVCLGKFDSTKKVPRKKVIKKRSKKNSKKNSKKKKKRYRRKKNKKLI